jgi:hypothetical protein
LGSSSSRFIRLLHPLHNQLTAGAARAACRVPPDHVERRSRRDLDVFSATATATAQQSRSSIGSRLHEAPAWRSPTRASRSKPSGWLRHHDERPCSFVDATSFALMRSLGIREALAFDGVFAAAGFVELRP